MTRTPVFLPGFWVLITGHYADFKEQICIQPLIDADKEENYYNYIVSLDKLAHSSLLLFSVFSSSAFCILPFVFFLLFFPKFSPFKISSLSKRLPL